MDNLLGGQGDSTLAHIIENALDAFIVINEDGEVIGWSRRAEELFGWPPAQAVGKPLSELIIPPEYRKAHTEGMQRYRETGTPRVQGRRIEIDAQHMDGHVFPIELSVTQIVSEGKRVFSAALRDITDRKQKENRLRDADRMKDEFLAMLGHELRNPLAPISTAAEILKLEDLDKSRIRRASEIISRQVGHMTALINDLLDASRVARGRITLKKEPLELVSIIADAVEQTHALIEARQHQLVIDPPAEPVRVEADRTRLTQIFVNLLNNAAKYTPEGGKICLSVDYQEAQVLITVRDNGVGISADLMPYLFDYFSQSERTIDRSEGGLGLGLGLVKTLVDLHEGKVWAESEGEGKGSVFFVRLPTLPSGHTHAPGTLVQVSNASPPLRIMVVDDNSDAANMLAALAQEMGHTTQVCYSGTQAISSAQAFFPQVVLLDIGLPDINGYEVARRVRAIPGMEKSILVALTGYGASEDVEKAIAAGFDQHLLKPATKQQLLDVFARTSATATASVTQSA